LVSELGAGPAARTRCPRRARPHCGRNKMAVIFPPTPVPRDTMQRDNMTQPFLEMPNAQGYFGEYGGQIIPPELKAVMDDINAAYDEVRQTAAFQDELADLYAHYVGRPSPIFHAKRLSARQGGARI